MVLICAVVVLLFWVGATWEIMRGNRRLTRLAMSDAPAPVSWPRVSIVVAARNEGLTLGAALPTLLALDYPDLEVIVVDDRSDDETGSVAERIAATDRRLHVEHVRELPSGWLGKNHALHAGAGRATGEWILFTDADIHFRPDALRRAVAHALARRLDMLAAVPQLSKRGHLLGICVGAFSLIFSMFVRPWQVSNPRSSAHGGVGAFNLLRTEAYRRAGGHEPIRLRPDDDLRLGRLLKLAGARCEVALGAGVISVEWYANVRELVRGLTKNVYAGTDYRPSLIVGGILAHAAFFLAPVVAALLTTGAAQACFGAAVVLMLATAVDNQRFDGGTLWHGLFFPAGLVVLDYILLRSMIVTHGRRGIVWRGTHYPLAELKRNRL